MNKVKKCSHCGENMGNDSWNKKQHVYSKEMLLQPLPEGCSEEIRYICEGCYKYMEDDFGEEILND